MDEKQETIADIVAEMRIFKCRNLETGELEECNAIAKYFADRIEAAQKREVGNGTKMCEALKCIDSIAKYLEAGTIRDVQHAYRNIQDRVRIALAAPLRNCDVGTVEEQTERFVDFARLYFQSEMVGFVMNWAQMPYEEGGKE